MCGQTLISGGGGGESFVNTCIRLCEPVTFVDITDILAK